MLGAADEETGSVRSRKRFERRMHQTFLNATTTIQVPDESRLRPNSPISSIRQVHEVYNSQNLTERSMAAVLRGK